jgi:hypothetical protein
MEGFSRFGTRKLDFYTALTPYVKVKKLQKYDKVELDSFTRDFTWFLNRGLLLILEPGPNGYRCRKLYSDGDSLCHVLEGYPEGTILLARQGSELFGLRKADVPRLLAELPEVSGLVNDMQAHMLKKEQSWTALFDLSLEKLLVTLEELIPDIRGLIKNTEIQQLFNISHTTFYRKSKI